MVHVVLNKKIYIYIYIYSFEKQSWLTSMLLRKQPVQPSVQILLFNHWACASC